MRKRNEPNPNPPNEPGSDGAPSDFRPYFCIPYWQSPRFAGDPVDVGLERPLPAGVISWECPGIHASPYSPGGDLTITVDVRNSGHGSALSIATVVVYWADPTVGFAKPAFFGVGTVAAPTMRDPQVTGFVSVTLQGTIPATAPDHICLLAYVTHALDPATAIADPINDRHWAQRNLFAVTTSISPIMIPFTVANPFDKEGLFELHVRSLDRKALELYAMHKKLEPGAMQLRMHLRDGLGRVVTDREGDAQIRLPLGPMAGQKYSLVLEFDHGMAPHQLTALEAVLYQSGKKLRPVGSLGIVMTGDDSPL